MLAFDGLAGLVYAKENKPDLIILDIQLPGMNGQTVCRKIREHELIKNTPIMMLTANNADIDRIIGRVIGADCYITKPFDIEVVLQQIEKLLLSQQE
jgi:DNA-binding response OmpR family regulator